MKLDNKYKIGYATLLTILVAYFTYTLHIGKLFYEISTTKQWEKWGSNHSSARSSRFYHK